MSQKKSQMWRMQWQEEQNQTFCVNMFPNYQPIDHALCTIFACMVQSHPFWRAQMLAGSSFLVHV